MAEKQQSKICFCGKKMVQRRVIDFHRREGLIICMDCNQIPYRGGDKVWHCDGHISTGFNICIKCPTKHKNVRGRKRSCTKYCHHVMHGSKKELICCNNERVALKELQSKSIFK